MLENDWRRLNQNNPATVFNGWDWNWLWWQHYGDLGELYILVARSEGVIVGIAPLYKTRSRMVRLFKFDTLRFIGQGGDTSPDDLNFIVDLVYEPIVIQALLEPLFTNPFPERLHLTDIPHNSVLWQLLQQLAQHHNPNYSVEFQGQYTTPLPADWDAYRHQISRNTHKQMKRRNNRLARQPGVSFLRATTIDEVERVREALMHLHQARWQSKGHNGNFQSKQYREFHRDLMHGLLSRGELFLLALIVDDQIIGVEYAFMANHTLALFQTGFDPGSQHLSPGHLLMTEAIKQAIESGAQRLDLLKGDYPYKVSYAAEQRVSVTVDLHKTFIGRALVALRERLRSD